MYLLGFFCFPLHLVFSKASGDTAEQHPPAQKSCRHSWGRHLTYTFLIQLNMFIFPLSLSGRGIFTIKYDFSCQLTHAIREFLKSIPALKVWWPTYIFQACLEFTFPLAFCFVILLPSLNASCSQAPSHGKSHHKLCFMTLSTLVLQWSAFPLAELPNGSRQSFNHCEFRLWSD